MCYNTVITRKWTGISNTRPLPNAPSMKNWVKLNEPLHYKIHKDQTSSYVSSFVRHSDQCVFSFYSIDLLQFGECQSAQTRSNPHCREIELPSDSPLWHNTVPTLIPCHRVHFRAAKRGLLLFSGRQTDRRARKRPVRFRLRRWFCDRRQGGRSRSWTWNYTIGRGKREGGVGSGDIPVGRKTWGVRGNFRAVALWCHVQVWVRFKGFPRQSGFNSRQLWVYGETNWFENF